MQGHICSEEITAKVALQQSSREMTADGSMSLCPGFIESRMHCVPGSMCLQLLCNFLQVCCNFFLQLFTTLFWQLFGHLFCNCFCNKKLQRSCKTSSKKLQRVAKSCPPKMQKKVGKNSCQNVAKSCKKRLHKVAKKNANT